MPLDKPRQNVNTSIHSKWCIKDRLLNEIQKMECEKL